MNIACIYHSRDLDGWMSAAIVKKWFIETSNDSVIEEGNSIRKGGDRITFIGWDYGDVIPNLSLFDKVIMCDVSFSPEAMIHLKVTRGDNFIWIDHHISAIKGLNDYQKSKEFNFNVNGLRNTKFAACELTWMHLFSNEAMPEIVRLLGRYDCFGHKGTHEEQIVLEFQYGARECMSTYKDCYIYLQDNRIVLDISFRGKFIYQYLCTEAKQTYARSFEIEFLEPLTTEEREHKVYKFLCVNQNRFNPINFGINYHKEGYDGFACFWFNKGAWNFSLYNDDGNVDCSAIAKQYGGGGHKGAAGFIVNDINKIIQ